MPRILRTEELVALDGVPRQATADDGSEHMLYRDGGIVKSVLLQDWPAVETALAEAEAARQQAADDAAALRSQILTLAQSAVGVSLGQLTAGQRNALIAGLLWRMGALTPDLHVRPLAEWLDRS